MKTVEASPIQQRYWLQAQLDPSSSAYNVCFVHTIDGLLDLEALQRAVDQVVASHEILRATFDDTTEGLTLTVHDAVDTPLTLHRVDPEDFDDAREAFTERIHLAPFDLSTGPVLRAGVMSAGPDRHTLVTVVHHVAIDGDATPMLFAQLGEAYSATEPPALQPSRVAASTAPSSSDAARAYWRETAAEMPVHTPLPTIGAGHGERARTATVPLPEETEAGLRRLSATFFDVMAAGWAALVHRYSGAETVAFAYPVNLEPGARMGCFLNTLPMALDVAGATFEELIARAQSARRDAEPRRGVMWEQIVEDLRSAGHLGREQPLLNVGLAPTHLRRVPLTLADVEVTAEAPPPARALWPLVLEYEVGSPTRLRLSGREDRFPAWLVEALAQTLLTLLHQAVAAPQSLVADLPLIDGRQRVRLAAHGQGATVDPRARGTLVDRLAEVAAATPDAVAVQSGVDGLTYWALDIRSNRTAHALLALLPAPPAVGDRVALLFERSAEGVIAMVAMAKLGLTYVPLQPTDPAERWLALMDRAGVVAVVGQHQLLDLLPASLPVRRFAVDAPGSLTAQPDTPIPCDATPESPAYMMFTAGSTGPPKGVLVPQRAVMRVACGGGPHAIDADDVVVHGSSLSFDISTWEVWGTLLMGGTLLIVSRAEVLDTARLQAKLHSHGATAMVLSVPLFHAHVDANPEVFGQLRLLIVGGDVVSPASVAAIFATPEGRPELVLNAYGPAENTVFSTVARVAEARPGEALPIGRPVAGSTCFVLDPTGRPVPVGFPGELRVGGLGVALGYHDDPSTERFSASHDLDPAGGMLYATGDRVRWRTDGQLDFLGRLDGQIQLHGQRLEPGEVAAAARRHPDVRQAVAVTTDGPEVELVLAYTLGPRSSLDDAALRQHLAASLPAYAVPQRRVRLEALPMTPHGKTDADAIVTLASRLPTAEVVHTPPTTDMERALADLWSRALDRQEVGVLDRFVDLGGDPLRAVRLAAAIRDTLGHAVSVADVYRAATIRALAVHLGDVAVEEAPSPAPPSTGVDGPKTLPLSLAQMAYWRLLRRGMSYACTSLMRLQARIDSETLLEAWDDVLSRHESPWMHLDPSEPLMHRVGRRMCNVTRMDLTRLDPESARYQATSRMRRMTQEPFQNRAPMLRVFLAQAALDDWYFGVVAPHALFDGHALQLLADELHDAYIGRLDGAPVWPPAPMSLDDYMRWERARVTAASVEASVAYYKAALHGDASWTVPKAHLRDTVHGEVATLDPADIERLQTLSQGLGVSLEATLTYCALLTLHGVHRADLVRCLDARSNRDEPDLERLPLMMAGAVRHQSRLDRAESFQEGARAFGARHVEASPHAHLPPIVLSGMERLLFMRGRLSHYLLSRLIGSLWAIFSPTPRVVLTYTVDRALGSLFYALERRVGRWLGRSRTRTSGCFVRVTSALDAHTPPGSMRLPIEMVRVPVDVPEVGPGAPLLDLHRDAEGLKALLQARIKPAAVRALLAAYQSVIGQVAEAPEVPLGEVMDALDRHAHAFEDAADDV